VVLEKKIFLTSKKKNEKPAICFISFHERRVVAARWALT